MSLIMDDVFKVSWEYEHDIVSQSVTYDSHGVDRGGEKAYSNQGMGFK